MSIAHSVEEDEIISLVGGDVEEVTEVSAPVQLPGALPGAEVEDKAGELATRPRCVDCPSCGRPPGKVIATGAASDYQMGVRWSVDQLRHFLQGYMSPDEARMIALKFGAIVVED